MKDKGEVRIDKKTRKKT